MSVVTRKQQARKVFGGLRRHGYVLLAGPMALLEFLFPYRDYGISRYFPWYRGTEQHQAHVREYGGPNHPWNQVT